MTEYEREPLRKFAAKCCEICYSHEPVLTLRDTWGSRSDACGQCAYTLAPLPLPELTRWQRFMHLLRRFADPTPVYLRNR